MSAASQSRNSNGVCSTTPVTPGRVDFRARPGPTQSLRLYRSNKPAPDARAAPPEAHESLIGRKTVEEVPLTGLSFIGGLAQAGWQTCLEAFAITGSIVGILIGATCFAFILRKLGGDSLIRLGLGSRPFGPSRVILTILGVIFLLEFFLDWIEITIIVLPLVVSTVSQMEPGFIDSAGFARPEDFVAARTTTNTNWFCVLMAVCLQTSFLTPPVGFALFYLKGVAPPEVRLIDLYRGVVPFVSLQLIGLLLVFLLGGPLVLWLPRLVYGW